MAGERQYDTRGLVGHVVGSVTLLFTLVALVVPAALAAKPATGADTIIPGHYIAVLKDSVEHPGAVAATQTAQVDGEVGAIYRHALKGFSATLSKEAAERLRRDPRVRYVVPDREFELLAQTTPTGVMRSFAAGSDALDIDEADDARVNADIAVMDTGIDEDHPDLNVTRRTNCVLVGIENEEVVQRTECAEGIGTDVFGHGTHVAGIVGALDNGIGTVGIAPGARLWSVRVGDDWGGVSGTSLVAATDWIVAHADEIEVLNMSFGCECSLLPFDEGVEAVIDAGVVSVTSAGNSDKDAKYQTPANIPEVITVSNLADYDGEPGGKAPELWRPSCTVEKQSEGETQRGPDDTLTTSSNWGALIDIAAPGSCIFSTMPGGEYAVKSGTSMSSPYVAGAAAILASLSNPNSKEDVQAIRDTLVEEGNYDWEDTSGDGIQEPLLDVGDEAAFHISLPPAVSLSPVSSPGTTSATLNGTVNPVGLETAYHFEYDTSEYKAGEGAHGTSVPVPDKSIGSGYGRVEVSQAIEGLKPATTYHLRLVATNAEGTSRSEDMSFTTWGSWSTQTTFNPPNPVTEAKLEAVSCFSSNCLAVGEDKQRGRAFGEYWTGSEWEKLPFLESEAPRLGTRLGVSCTSATSCVVVGANAGAPVAERWRKLLGTWQGEDLSAATPSGATNVKLTGVSCTEASACTAVGSYTKESKTKTLAERWNGTSWSVQTTPNPESGSAELLGVSCEAASSCTAVGKQGTSPYAMRWNGTSWSTTTVPSPAGMTEGQLQGVSCTSSSFCMAIGIYKEASGYYKTLAERWNGSAWSVSSTPNPSGNKGSYLSGVSCTSSSACIAVGRYNTALEFEMGSEAKTLAQSWNGTAWTTQSSPNPEGKKLPRLNGVSCTSSTACTAVGYSKISLTGAETVTLGQRWNGESWSTQTTFNPPNPVTEAKLEAVSCFSSNCLAVGEDKQRGRAFGEYWTGSEWEKLPFLESEAPRLGTRLGVSCTSATSCVVVGANAGAPVAERWRKLLGTWQGEDLSAATPSGATNVKLTGVSCTEASACTAVGSYTKESKTKTLAERWNGTSWSVQTTPNPESGSAELLGVSCEAASSCTAVGKQGTSPYAMRWNGTSWSTTTVPSPAGMTEGQLQGVSCTSSSFCMAIGIYKEASGYYKTLAERWNGSAWSVSSTPNPSGNKGSYLSGVSCTSSSACIAVGRYNTALEFEMGSEAKTLAQSWNGTAWTTQSSPNPEGKKLPRLNGVSCTSSTACTAVGYSKISLTGAETVTLGQRYE